MLPEERELIDAGFGDDELRATADENLGVGVGTELPPAGRFLLGVTRLLRLRMLTDPDEESIPALFFFLGENDAPEEAVDFQPLLHHGRLEVGSRLWFVGEVATNARGVPCAPWTDGEAFTKAMTLGVESWPAVLFDPSREPAMVTFYRKGIGDGNAAATVPLNVHGLDLNDVFEAIDRAHESFLATPKGNRDAGITLWEKPTKHWPVLDAEKEIQRIIHIGIQMAVPTCDVRPELEGTSGRSDLEIHAPTSANGLNAARVVLELKVLRSYGSTGKSVSDRETTEWIEDGVTQAASYRDEHGFPDAALCCFDMRKTPTGPGCFAGVVTLAKDRAVICRQWPIFASAKAKRQFSPVEAMAS